MMDDSESSLSYCPDFSDICSEESSFWDFLKRNEVEKVKINKDDYKDNFCPDESECSSDVLNKEKGSTSKLKEFSGVKLSDQETDFKMKEHETNEFDSNKYKKSDSESISVTVSYEQNSAKDISKDDDDEFWDFLKSDNLSVHGNYVGDQQPLSLVELEEMKCLSSLAFSVDEQGTLCNSEVNKHMDWNSTISHEDSNLCNKNSTPSEILQDLYLTMPEGNSTSRLQKRRKKSISSRGSNNEETSTNIGICKNDAALRDLILSLDESKKPDLKGCESNDQNRLNSFHNINKNELFCTVYNERNQLEKTNVQACNKKNSVMEQNSKSLKNSETKSNTENHLLNEDNSKGCKSLALRENNNVCTNSTTSNLSHAMKILPKSRNENMQLPIISSFYSISSCTGVFNPETDFIKEKNNLESENFGENNLVKDILSTDQNETAPEEIKSYTPNSFSENISKGSNSSTKNELPKHSQSTKRYIQENSPKNSIFRITDCQPTISEIHTSSKNSSIPISPKRQKTNCTVSILNVKSKGSLKAEKDQATNSTVPLKYIVLPTSTLGTNVTAPPNPTPLYFILPKSLQSNNNQNTELVMVINNNNQIANNIDMKTATNPNNCRVPVCTAKSSSRIVNTQVLNSNYLGTSKNIQQVSLPVISVMNLQLNPNVSYNYSQSNMSNSVVQPMVNDTMKLQLPIDAVNKINTFPSTLSQTNLQRENGNFCMVSSGLSSNINNTRMSQSATIPVLPNNGFQLRNINSEVIRHPLNKMPVLLPSKNLQSNQFIQSLSSGPAPPQRKQVRQEKFKPIKSISLGKDKNAFQQISVPVKMDSLIDPKILSHVYDNLDTSDNLHDINAAHSFLEQIPAASIKVQSSQEVLMQGHQQQNNFNYDKGIFSFAPHKRNSEGILVKRNLITNETEVVKKNQPINNQCGSLLRVINSVNLPQNFEIKSSEDKIKAPISNSSQQELKSSQLISADISNAKDFVDKPKETSILTSVTATKRDNIPPESQSHVSKTPRSTLTTLQELFPPPISMIPVCVMQTVQTTNKPTVSKVLVLQSTSSINNELSKLKCQRKTGAKKTTKTKKPERKTVKQLLEERYKHVTESQMNQVGINKVLRPVYKLTGDGAWVPASLPESNNTAVGVLSNDVYCTDTEKIANLVANSYKRPNIMMLPSATKAVQSNIFKDDTSKEVFQVDGASKAQETSYKIFESSPEILFENVTSKDCKPRYYDMSELRIGYFKVEDNTDSCGRFRSKFKVLFTKRQFVYEFPAIKCNQVDLNCYSGDQVVRIQVPFQTLVAISVHNRQIIIQVNRFPQIGLRKCNERFSGMSEGNDYSEDNYLWFDAVQNSLLHKIILRKRQADNLKTYLCQFDPNFFLLFDVKNNTGLTPTGASFSEELASINFRKIYQRNKKNIIRRLPQWDSEAVFEPIEFIKGDHLLSPNQVCSCRISCKSLRCSCVKAAKSCSTGGTVCLCINCDNPLNVLDSFGINLDFSLSDCCLFQNIYRIPKLKNFLQKCLKLSCCNTVARVLDCIPGTILCPNTECNESLEFSWCQVIICYPGRNPRNHCSFCGLCCFSNKRHCSICSRCYIVTPKSPDCPNCRGSGIAVKPFYLGKNEDEDLAPLPFVETKPCSKPEIIILDSSINTKPRTTPMKTDFISTLKMEEQHADMNNSENESRALINQQEDQMEYTELLKLVTDKADVMEENFDTMQENHLVDNKLDLKECKAEIDDLINQQEDQMEYTELLKLVTDKADVMEENFDTMQENHLVDNKLDLKECKAEIDDNTVAPTNKNED